MDSDFDGGLSKRQFLGALLAGAGVAASRDIWQAMQESSSRGGSTAGPLELALPVATATAASPTDLEAQYRGGPMNQGYLETTESPVGVKNIETVFDGTPIARAPITNSNGKMAGITENGVVFADINGTEINSASLIGEPNHGLWHNGDYIVGDAEKTAKINPDTGQIISQIDRANQGSILKTEEALYTDMPGAVQKIDPDTMEPIQTYDTGPTSSRSINMIEEDNVLVSNAPDPNAFDTENNQQIDQISAHLHPWLSIDNDYVYCNTFDEIQARKIPKQQGEEFELVDTEFLNGGTFGPPTVVSENGTTFLYSGTADEHDDLGYTVQGYSFDGDTIEEEWRQEVPGTVAETMAVGDTLIASGRGVTGFNRHTGEKLFQEEILGRAGIPYQNKIPVGDANNDDQMYILEMETQDISDGPSPDLDLFFSGLPEESVPQNTTVDFAFNIDNTGGEFVGDLVFEYAAGDAETIYDGSITETVPEETTLEVDHEYTPGIYDESDFTFAYDEATETITVTVPVRVDDEQTDTTITGSPETNDSAS